MEFDDEEINVIQPEINAVAPQLPLETRIQTATPPDVPILLEEIAAIEDNVMQSLYSSMLAGKFKIGQKIINEKIRKLRHKKTDESELIMSASFPDLVDLGLDSKGDVTYIILCDRDALSGNPFLLTARDWKCDEGIYIPPPKAQVEFLLPRVEQVEKYFAQGKDDKLFMDVFDYFSRFAFLTVEQKVILTCFVFQTYIQDHPDIFYIAIILLHSPPIRGKSRSSKAIAYISYRGMIEEQVREPVIFRLTENLQTTIILDVRDVWKQAVKRDAMDILLWRYEKGAKIHRVLNPEAGAFKDMRAFKVFGPTVIATNKSVHHVLDTRCIPLLMLNRPGTYEDPKPELGLELKERLTAWRARMMSQKLPAIAQIEGIVGRLWDVSKPLFQICLQECPGAFETLRKAILAVAEDKAADAKYSPENDILGALRDLSPEGQKEWKIKMEDLVETLNIGRIPGTEIFPAVIGKKVKELGIVTKKIQGHSVIYLNGPEFETLLKQYGVNPDEENPVIGTDLTVQSIVDEKLKEIEEEEMAKSMI